jgi:SAM-dependent methyltransferase
MDRKTIILADIDRSMMLIEVGPSHKPLVPKRHGWKTTVVDHAPRAELIAKYTDHGVDLDQIEEVDIIWSGGDLTERFPQSSLGTFDAILASHVVEHMPDPITFLRSAQRLLKPDGTIVLAVPDKRYTFDFFGPITSTGDWLTAYGVAARTHTKRAAFNHVAYAVTNRGQITWSHEHKLDALRFAHDLSDAAGHFGGNTDSGHGNTYIDYHAWRFTPSSFALLILEIGYLSHLDMRVASCTPPLGHEFFVFLKRGRMVFQDAESLNTKRLDLLRTSVLELRQATDLLLGAI